MIKSVRSWSGILPISIALEGNTFSCKYDCSFCSNECVANGAERDISRSYLSSEGTFIRGICDDFQPIRQIIRRLLELETMGHYPDKIELIVLGGTWDCYPANYRKEFIHKVFYACNQFSRLSKHLNGDLRNYINEWLEKKPFNTHLPFDKSGEIQSHFREMLSLDEEKNINTNSKIARIIGIVLETRPDQISRLTTIEKRQLGATRIQLGIQHTNNDVLKFNNRGHTVEASIKAIKSLKNNCYKVDGHIMPDLPNTTIEEDYKMVDEIFLSDKFQLDYIKIYPCLDLPFTKSREWKNNGTWKPYAEENYPEFLKFLCYTLSIVPPWTRINRVQRDFPLANEKNKFLGYTSDNIKTNLNQLVQQEMKKYNMYCFDIRNREIKNTNISKYLNKAQLFIRQYMANDGIEFFISVEIPKIDIDNKEYNHPDNTYLLGLIRLRFDLNDINNINKNHSYLKEFKHNSFAKIRELHVYGFIHENNNSIQHSGIGKFLLNVAEYISYFYNFRKIAIISGVGVRNYYKKFGYTLDTENEGEFMIKNINYKPFNEIKLFNTEYNLNNICASLTQTKIHKKYFNNSFNNYWNNDTFYYYPNIKNAVLIKFNNKNDYLQLYLISIIIISIILRFINL